MGDVVVELTVRDQDQDIVIIDVVGGITQKQLSQSEEILPKLVGKDVFSRKVIFNLEKNDFVDSSGITWLLICHKRCIENGGRMALHSIPQLVMNVLKILRMETVFEIADNEADAISKVQSDPS